MDSAEKFLNFLVGEKAYAVPLLKVREVLAMPALTPIPSPPPHVAGLMNLRGQIITIFDLRSFLKSKPNDQQPTVIISDMEFGQIGIIVDSVSSVISPDISKVSDIPPGSTNSNIKFVTKIYSEQEKMTLMLDVEQILTQEIRTLSSKSAPKAS